jgi:hypothetical protein
MFYMTRIKKSILFQLYILDDFYIKLYLNPNSGLIRIRITMKSYFYLSPDHKDGMIYILYSGNFIAIQIFKKPPGTLARTNLTLYEMRHISTRRTGVKFN